MTPIGVIDTLAGREILLTGASGFVGKVLLAMLLEKVPDIGRVHLLLRPNGVGDALRRFERIVNESPAFERLHERYGPELSAFLRQRVAVHTGDLTKTDLGLDPASFGGRFDLVVNVAAVVDFEPDVRSAFRTNVHGAIHAAELARDCGAGMVQVSTCFVAGRRSGRIDERDIDRLPAGGEFDAEAEYAALASAIGELEAFHRSADFDRELHDAARLHIIARGGVPDAESIERHSERMRHARVARDWKALGTERADERGWPNTYTYTKAITEGLLRSRFADVPVAIFRPAVVESAVSFPFPGWNEGFNTCGPLAYLIGTWFKAMPGRRDNPFDVVPVDMVCAGLTLVGAAVIRGEHAPVYQCGTSHENPLTLGRAAELTGLGQRRWLRKNGATLTERVFKSRSDTTVYEDAHPLSVANVEELMTRAADTLRSLPERTPEAWKKKASKAAFKLERSRRTVHRVQLMVDAFTPFTRDLRQVFVADNLGRHEVVEPEFAWDPRALDWRDYWLDVHMPGMRRWSFPLFEGDDPPKLEPAHHVDLHAPSEAAQ